MTPKKQVSPAIRILRGERDASARATHLEAATRKFLVTTNERKQMSTKTNFKRIALVAIAALGLGVLSSVPAKAVLDGAVTLTTTTGSATDGRSDSSTAGTVSVRYLTNTTDTLTLTASLSAKPTGAVSPLGLFAFNDSNTSINAVTPVPVALTGTDSATSALLTPAAAGGWVGAKFKFFMDSSTARLAGTYTYTITATPYPAGVRDATKVVTTDISLTVAALSTASTIASAATSTAYIASTSALAAAATTDSVVTSLSTASSTAAAVVRVVLKNAASGNALESLTVTTSVGSIGTSSNQGRSVVLQYTSGGMDVNVYPDGTSGVATITIKSTSVTFANKTVVFYSAAPKTLTASVINSTPGVGSTTAIAVDAKDANGNRWAGTLYTYSSAVATISNDAATCGYVAANDRHECSVTGVVAGTATITVRDAATVATSTVASSAVSLTVVSNSLATVKLAFDKASYAPGEKAILSVSALDSAGKPLPAATYANLFTTGGISLSMAAGNSSDTLTAVAITTTSPAAQAIGTGTDPVKLYTVYMPVTGGTLTASATGGTSLPLAGQVAVKASATVTDSGAAALAAVNALATTVASLRTLITTLTNLVLKIQKKVKA